MDESPINLENILEQAPKWTFAGDFTLLQWMKEISQDLESRATKTTDALTKLNNNIKSTNIALDNVANRLTTLQFGNQFVECRVQDDDETLINSSEQSRKRDNQPEATVTSKELLNTFLDNNLKVLRNCHERYSIELDDSDDDEISKEKTCIYQPINPYNEKPLPYIFGSKDWHSKWHVGLYENEQDNSYSGDEISEEFSETSSTSHLDDNESFESNTEWASSNSVDNFNANIEIKNASSLRGSQALHSGTPVPIEAAKSEPAAISESSSVSTTPSSLARHAMKTTKLPESLTKRSESVNSINSRTSSKKTAKFSANKKESILQHKIPKPKVIDLFAEPSDDNENITCSSVSSGQNVKRVANDNQLVRKVEPPALRTQSTPFVDLFAEPPEDFSSSTTSSLSSSHNTKRKIVNLFEDNDENTTAFAKDDKLLAPVNKENELPPVTTSKPFNVTKSSKSLFDDSDDDEDFLKAFVKKSLSKESNKSSLSNTLLFDADTNNSTKNSLPQSNESRNTISEEHSGYKSRNLFDETKTKGFDLFSSKLTNAESQIPVQNPKADNVIKSNNSSKPLLSYLDKSTVEGNVKKSEDVINDSVAETKPRTKINLFDDVEDGDDLFSTRTKNKENSQTVVEKPVKLQKNSSFEDKTITKDTSEFDNRLDNFPNDNSIPHKTEITGKGQTINTNFVPDSVVKTKDIISPQVNTEADDGENFVEPPAKQEQNDIITTPQPTENIVLSVPEEKNQKVKTSNKYEFSSILFSDEPPEDDDEFFETLTKTASNPNSNYNTIDLENDIFEPDLPKVPVASTTNNQTDSTDNFYTGLQLFSDIPPDDVAISGSVLNAAPDTNQSKRLHSVFYDDFNETLLALNQKQQIDKEISAKLPLLNDLPSVSGKDLTDHKVPEQDHETFNYDSKGKNRENNSKNEEALPQSHDRNTVEVSNKRQVSKLQMPHVNINVQALLPGASNVLRKSKEDGNKSAVISTPKNDTKQSINLPAASSGDRQLSAAKPRLADTPRSSETEHILPNMTKNRVKAPAARRPSTRKARQENYRKSLIEQQNTLTGDEDDLEINETGKTDTKTTISQILQQKSNSKDSNDNSQAGIFNENIGQSGSHSVGITRNSATSVRTETAKKTSSVHNIENPSSSALSSSETTEASANDLKIKALNETSTLRPKQLSSSLFFDADEDDDDNDFFKHIKTANIMGIQKAKESEGHLIEKSSLNTNDLPHSETKVNMTIPQEPEPSTFLKKETSSGDVQSLTTTQAYHDPQTSGMKISNQVTANNLKLFVNDDGDDDEDLFKTTTTASRSFLRKRDINERAKAQFKSFLDSETDEEPNIAAQSTAVPSLAATSSSVNLKPKNTKDDKPKLFSDSETDSDDLFGKYASTKVSINKKISTEVTTKSQTKPEPKSTLFEDDSDSDDFLASKNSFNKNVPKIATQTNPSLFSDLDSDEDDLFGSGAAKAIAPSVTKVKNLQSTPASLTAASVAESSKSQTVDDNPLADLL